MIDVTDTIQSKSNQLNAADLPRPIVVEITGANLKKGDEQPLTLALRDRQPWKPCKSMIRLLCKAWGTDAEKWIGRRARLYCDDSVLWAGKPVGGIRVSALSDIERKLATRLPFRRGQYKEYSVAVLSPDEGVTALTVADLKRALITWQNEREPGTSMEAIGALFKARWPNHATMTPDAIAAAIAGLTGGEE